MESFHRFQDPVAELYHKLEESHLVYLQADEYPVKSEKRRELEVIIERFLCQVPNENKYVNKNTSEILHRSASEFKEFSGYKASKGWAAIAQYASNLFAQPWRKEYKSLKTYCGYYKYEVEANLLGAEVMFELMGYQRDNTGTLVLEGPIDPLKVASVSRDAIVAFVECKILKQIWEQVSNKLNISWLEILYLRENNVSTPSSAVQYLNYLKSSDKQELYYNHPPQPKPHIMPSMNPIYHTSLPKYTSHFNNQNINNTLTNGVFQNRQYFQLCQQPPQPLPLPLNPEHSNLCNCLTNVYIDNSGLHEPVVQRYHPVCAPSVNNFPNVNNHHLTTARIKLNSHQETNHSRMDEIDNKSSIVNESVYNKTTTSEMKQFAKEQKTSIDVSKKNINVTRDRRSNLDWNCEYCTYLNSRKVEICEICGKSRRKGKEDEPLVSGGKECPQCTLINKKDVDKCDACHADLEHSPTYI